MSEEEKQNGKCECYKIDGELTKIGDVFKQLETIAMTSSADVFEIKDGKEIVDVNYVPWANKPSTNLLECRKDCGDYFLWNQHFGEYNLYSEDQIRVQRYQTDLNRKDMQMIFRNLDSGIVPIQEIDQYVDLATKSRNRKKPLVNFKDIFSSVNNYFRRKAS